MKHIRYILILLGLVFLAGCSNSKSPIDNNKDSDSEVVSKALCSIDGCKNGIYKDGLCAEHFVSILGRDGQNESLPVESEIISKVVDEKEDDNKKIVSTETEEHLDNVNDDTLLEVTAQDDSYAITYTDNGLACINMRALSELQKYEDTCSLFGTPMVGDSNVLSESYYVDFMGEIGGLTCEYRMRHKSTNKLVFDMTICLAKSKKKEYFNKVFNELNNMYGNAQLDDDTYIWCSEKDNWQVKLTIGESDDAVFSFSMYHNDKNDDRTIVLDEGLSEFVKFSNFDEIQKKYGESDISEGDILMYNASMLGYEGEFECLPVGYNCVDSLSFDFWSDVGKTDRYYVEHLFVTTFNKIGTEIACDTGRKWELYNGWDVTLDVSEYLDEVYLYLFYQKTEVYPLTPDEDSVLLSGGYDFLSGSTEYDFYVIRMNNSKIGTGEACAEPVFDNLDITYIPGKDAYYSVKYTGYCSGIGKIYPMVDKSNNLRIIKCELPNGYVSLWYLHEHIIWDSSSRYLTDSELMYMDKDSLRLARNEIYARHGRKFTSKDLNDYFCSTSWYVPRYESNEFNENVLNEYEKYNVSLIKKYE